MNDPGDGAVQSITAVLFDLDGTLVDTAPDMGGALNQLLEEHGKAPLAATEIRPHVSHGARGLIDLAFGEKPGGQHFDGYRTRFLDIYQNRLCDRSRVFDGMPEVIAHIESTGMVWGVVTNKPDYLTQPLLKALRLQSRAACIVSGDTVTPAKPHPAPLLYASDYIGHRPERCVYVGDAERDIIAGTGAGMSTVVALFGYLGENDNPEAWGAQGMIDHPGGLISWLNSNNS